MAHTYNLIQQELEVIRLSHDKIDSFLTNCLREKSQYEHQLAQANAYIVLMFVASTKQKMLAQRYKALAELMVRHMPAERVDTTMALLGGAQDIPDENLLEQVNKEFQQIGAINHQNSQGQPMNYNYEAITSDYLIQLVQNFQMPRQQTTMYQYQQQRQPMTPEVFDTYLNALTNGSSEDNSGSDSVPAHQHQQQQQQQMAPVPIPEQVPEINPAPAPPTPARVGKNPQAKKRTTSINYVTEPPKRKRARPSQAKSKSKSILMPKPSPAPASQSVVVSPKIEPNEKPQEEHQVELLQEASEINSAIRTPPAAHIASQHPAINHENNLRQTDLRGYLGLVEDLPPNNP